MEQVLTVSQLNGYLKTLIDDNRALRNLMVKGEISNFTNHIKTGHFYFSIKDQNCSIRCIMFRSYAQRISFEPENGMNVIINGTVRFFERDGAVQLYCEQMQPDGIGALYLAFEQLKTKLAAEGLFDPEQKKSLPDFPKKIGIVTSKTGAALQDILNILSRRFPLGTAVLIPVLVQGENAPESICRGIALAETQTDIDLLIVGRGGGSIEDLWSFNDERVVRAVAACKIPVISAIGHEIDYTLTDFAADLRAPTPSAAAELAVPDQQELFVRLDHAKIRLERGINSLWIQQFQRVKQLQEQLKALSPQQKTMQGTADLQQLKTRLQLAAEHLLQQKKQLCRKQVAMLEALSPLKVLTRGYSITYSEKQIVSKVNQVKEGMVLRTLLSDGEVESQVLKTTENRS